MRGKNERRSQIFGVKSRKEDESTEASPKVAQTLRPILVTGERLIAVDPGMRDDS